MSLILICIHECHSPPEILISIYKKFIMYLQHNKQVILASLMPDSDLKTPPYVTHPRQGSVHIDAHAAAQYELCANT